MVLLFDERKYPHRAIHRREGLITFKWFINKGTKECYLWRRCCQGWCRCEVNYMIYVALGLLERSSVFRSISGNWIFLARLLCENAISWLNDHSLKLLNHCEKKWKKAEWNLPTKYGRATPQCVVLDQRLQFNVYGLKINTFYVNINKNYQTRIQLTITHVPVQTNVNIRNKANIIQFKVLLLDYFLASNSFT